MSERQWTNNHSKHKDMAEKSTILKCVVGSTLHGLNLGDSADRDEKGVCIETLESCIGFNEFEQYEFRSATARSGVADAKSEAGDLDLTIYSLRKFLRLALKGNPTILELLFVPFDKCLISHAVGRQLQDLAPHIVSRSAGKAFLGYMESQRQKILGERGQKKVNRPELEEKYGFDTKYAMHVLRLGLQGVELLQTGRISIPMSEVDRSYLKGVRTGAEPLQSVLTKAGNLERELKDLLSTSPLPETPDVALVEDWMISRYWEFWRANRFMTDHPKLDEGYDVH